MFIVVKRHTLLLLGLALIFSAGVTACLIRPPAESAFADAEQGRPVYVIDAGHGGEDGGALSQNGVKESDINLAIARDLDALLLFLGEETVMIRTEDVSIYSGDAETLHQKKVSDLKNRVALVNETEGAVLVSIHQNSLPTVPSVHGAQVFYGTVELSEAYASSVQAALNASVNTENKKQEKKIDSSIFLMKNVNRPAILIESGFMSNSAETAKLQQPDYQKTLAVVIASGILSTDTEETEREAS